jgi:hypothetical protein
MYKIALQPNQDNSALIIKVLKKVTFFNLTYWLTVERILCASRHAGFQKERILSKYNCTIENAPLQKSEIAMAHIGGFAIQ